MPAMTVDKWVDAQQSQGKYSFLRRDALGGTRLSPEAVKKALQRLSRRGRVIKAKDYFYVIVPLEYANAGGPPATWFIHELMAAMGLPYYVGLLSAAALHGASHHQPQEFQVLTDRSVRPITVGRARIRFFASKSIGKAAVVNLKTPTGAIRVSALATTAVDLVRFARSAGYFDNVAGVLAELAPMLDARKLLAAVRLVGDVPNAQRLGYILDQVRAPKLATGLHEWIERRGSRAVPLHKGRSVEVAPENQHWHVLVNGPLEVEA